MGKLSFTVKIILAVIVMVGLFFGVAYFWHSSSTKTDAGVSTAGYQVANLSASQEANREFITLLDEVGKISLSTDVIQNLRQQLQDFSPVLPTIPVERSNPFAPVGVNRPAGAAILSPGATTTTR